MKKQPPWKAENARIRKELAARRKPEPVPFTVVQVPLRTVNLHSYHIFAPIDCDVLPDFMRRNIAEREIIGKMGKQLGDFITLERAKGPGEAETWTGSLLVVKEEPWES